MTRSLKLHLYNTNIIKNAKNNLVIALNESNLTKKDLAYELGLSYPSMLSKLSDPGTLKVSEMIGLCKCLKLDINELLTNNI